LANGITTSNCSLYPTTIIAYNIDYSTIVFDESIPDSLCHVMEWSDHLNCEHDPKVIRKNQLSDYIDTQQAKLKELREKRDKKINKLCRQEIVNEINKITEEMKPYREERAQIAKTISKNSMCAERRYRFLKEPKGVIPTILQNLLDARANTRKIIKNNKKEILLLEDNKDKIKDLKLLNNVLDKRQLAYKISANSMYGSWGVKKGYLPFMPGAMSCTFMGRTNIEIVAKTIPEKYGGELVYGDTDSNYIHFPKLKTAHESWDHAEMVAEQVSKLFPKPIKC
jgi:DNA polymerase elongation subunit (family B)